MENNEKRKFYQTTWFMWIMIVFVAPVGIFMLFKQNKYNKKVRVAISIVFGLIWIIAAKGSGGSSSTSTSNTAQSSTVQETKKEEVKKQETKKEEAKKQEAKKEETVKEPVFDFSNSELTKENITKAIVDIVGKDKLKSVEITVENSKNIVDIAYNPGTVWDEKALVKNNAITATNVMEVLFKNPKVDKVWVWTETEMQDAKGNNSTQKVVNVALTKENAKDINWKNFKTKVVGDYKALFNIADSKFIHPGIAQKLK